ncbi:MAG TPA: hypothetical protein VLH19_02450 [Patescibacteria group bacterium]|nr:hypothetical protein [Patescibacteria group bacterium]
MAEEQWYPGKDNFQWEADTSRLLKIALRSHDPESLSTVMERMSEHYPPELVEKMVMDMMTRLMTTENWSFVDEEGNESPLL